MDKDSPENVAKNIINAVEAGVEDIYPDVMSVQIGQFYASNPKAVEAQFSSMGE